VISTIFAISAAYVVLAVLLLAFSLRAPFAWWVKAAAIVVSTFFFIEVFFATRDLLSYPSPGKLPPHFQLLWARVVEPDSKSADPGAIFLWVEEIDANNVPDGSPRAFRLPYTRPLAEKSDQARDAIMAGHAQEGTAEDMAADTQDATSAGVTKPEQDIPLTANTTDNGSAALALDSLTERVEFRPLSLPLLPPKVE
jgi:hypothetical protein